MIDLKELPNYGDCQHDPRLFSDGGSYTTVDAINMRFIYRSVRYFRHWPNPHVLATKKFLHKLRQTEYYR